MAYQYLDIPEIRPEFVNNARLFANRVEMIKNLGIPQGSSIAEIGVANGDFTERLITELKPSHFFAADLFEMEKFPMHWGIPSEILFRGKTHFDFFKDRFSHVADRMTILRGFSSDTLPTIEDRSLDMIYIDAAHDYKNVSSDGAVCANKVKNNGILIFNDYLLFDPFINAEYGVVPAVNEMLATGEWQVIGFALQRHMFCDIAIRRTGTEETASSREA